MSKFTKGKWRVKYNPIIQGIFDEDNKPIQLNEANARLIAAAPEMYNWLKTIAGVFDKGNVINVSGIKELLARIDGEVKYE